MYWPRELHLLRVPVEVPPQYTLVGTLPPFTDEPCRSYGGWNDGYDVYLQIRWQAIPEERRRAFKAVSYTHLDVYKRQMVTNALHGTFPKDWGSIK